MKFDPMQYVGFPDASALDAFLPAFEVPARLVTDKGGRDRRPRAAPQPNRQAEPRDQPNTERCEERWEDEGGSVITPAAPER